MRLSRTLLFEGVARFVARMSDSRAILLPCRGPPSGGHPVRAPGAGRRAAVDHRAKRYASDRHRRDTPRHDGARCGRPDHGPAGAAPPPSMENPAAIRDRAGDALAPATTAIGQGAVRTSAIP